MGKRVQLVFALENGGRIVCRMYNIVLSVARDGQIADGRRLKGVTIWRFDNKLGLGIDGAEDQLVDLRVLLREGLVGRQLIRRVSKPFGNDVAWERGSAREHRVRPSDASSEEALPVMINDCGPSHCPSSDVPVLSTDPLVWNLTVVSVVDYAGKTRSVADGTTDEYGRGLTGNVFSNNRARSGSFMRETTSSMTFSMASE